MKKVIILFALLPFIWSCSNTQSAPKEEAPVPGNSEMIVEHAFPTEFSPGTLITLYGKALKDSLVTVLFDGVPADAVFNLSTISIQAIVPVIEGGKAIEVKVSTVDRKLYSNAIRLNSTHVPANVPQVFWTTHDLYSGNVGDGRLKIKKLFEDDFPRGLIVDHAKKRLIWGNGFGQVFTGDIGTLEKTEICRLGEFLSDVVLDAKGEWLYYIQEHDIKRVSLHDTTKVEILFKGRSEPRSLKLSADESALFWCESGSLQVISGLITEKTLTTLIGPDAGLLGPRSIDIDESTNKMFIADAPMPGQSSIWVSDLDGKNLEKILTTNNGIGEMVVDIAWDKKFGYLYWMNSKGRTNQNFEDGAILRCTLKEKHPEVVFQPVNYGFQLAF